MISRTLLIAGRPFGKGLGAERVASAIAEGLAERGWETDPWPIADEEERVAARAAVRTSAFEERLRAARALAIAEPQLSQDTLAGSVAFELATSARQAGVPAYAITRENLLDSFDARILDLQTILEARTHRSLRAAGGKLAKLA